MLNARIGILFVCSTLIVIGAGVAKHISTLEHSPCFKDEQIGVQSVHRTDKICLALAVFGAMQLCRIVIAHKNSTTIKITHLTMSFMLANGSSAFTPRHELTCLEVSLLAHCLF